jgi:uncharacterized protein YceK
MKNFKLARLLAGLLLFALVGCAGVTSKMNPRDTALSEYAAAVRWSEFDEAQAFLDPAVRLEHPLTDLERERLKLIQVTGYEVKGRHPTDDGGIEQTVEIRLVSRNTQLERIITDHQTWRWDAEGKRYWLTTGLPDFNPR